MCLAFLVYIVGYMIRSRVTAVKAVQVGWFVEREVDGLHFELDDVDPRLLARARRVMRPGAGVSGDASHG
jgi:hypothetical protein